MSRGAPTVAITVMSKGEKTIESGKKQREGVGEERKIGVF